MKLPILIFALAASASAQTVTSDLQTAQTAIAAALTTIQNTPPPAPDPVAVAWANVLANVKACGDGYEWRNDLTHFWCAAKPEEAKK